MSGGPSLLRKLPDADHRRHPPRAWLAPRPQAALHPDDARRHYRRAVGRHDGVHRGRRQTADQPAGEGARHQYSDADPRLRPQRSGANQWRWHPADRTRRARHRQAGVRRHGVGTGATGRRPTGGGRGQLVEPDHRHHHRNHHRPGLEPGRWPHLHCLRTAGRRQGGRYRPDRRQAAFLRRVAAWPDNSRQPHPLDGNRRADAQGPEYARAGSG